MTRIQDRIDGAVARGDAILRAGTFRLTICASAQMVRISLPLVACLKLV